MKLPELFDKSLSLPDGTRADLVGKKPEEPKPEEPDAKPDSAERNRLLAEILTSVYGDQAPEMAEKLFGVK